MILSATIVALGCSAVRAMEPTATPATEEETSRDIDAEVAALMAPVGGLTSEAISGRIRSALGDTASSDAANDQLAQIPGVQDRVRARFRQELPALYPDVAEEVGITLPQAEQLFDLLAKQNDEARTSTLSQQERIQKEEAQFKSLLGNQYPNWQEYRVGLPARLQIRDLEAALIAYDLALSSAQIDALMSALTAVHTQEGFGVGSFTPEANRMQLDAAAPHLSPEQLDVYQKVLERYSTRARAQGRPRN